MIKKVVIPLAGYGTRMYPGSATIPKELFSIVNKPIMHFIMEEALEAEIEEFIIVISPKNFLNIKHYFDTHFPNLSVKYVFQNEMLGWMDAILLCEHEINGEPFAFMLADNIFKGSGSCIKKLVDTYQEYKKSVIGVYKVPKQKCKRYGIIDSEPIKENLYMMKSFLEKPCVEQVGEVALANVGRNIFTPEVFEYLRKIDRNLMENRKIEQVFSDLVNNSGVVVVEYVGKWLDTGNPKSFVKSFWELLDDFENLNGIKKELMNNDIRSYSK